jgi:CheY-like chemotaxis protein/GAF domain-containing protein
VRVAPAFESLLHLLPTAASLVSADGEILAALQAAPICRLLASPPAGHPDPCAQDCRALAHEALAAAGRARGTCTAGLSLVAEPLRLRGRRPGEAGILVAAVSEPPREARHWEEVALRFRRPLDEVLAALRATPHAGLRGWEGEERLEVAASVLSRILEEGGEEDAGQPRSPAESGPLAAERHRAPQLVVEVAHAAARAIDDTEVLRGLQRSVREHLGLHHAFALLLRSPAHGGPVLLDAPPGLRPESFTARHPAVLAAASGSGTTHRADLATWPGGEALAAAGIERLLLLPVRVLGELAAVLFFQSDPREEAPAALARRCRLLDDLAPIATAHLTGVRALVEEQRRTRQITALHDVTMRMSSSLDVDVVLDAVVDGFADALGFTRTGVFFHDEETGTITGVASRGPAERGRIKVVEGPLSAFPAALAAAAAGRAIFVRDADGQVPREYRERFGVTCFVLVPLLLRGELLGFIAADRAGERFDPSAADLALATTLATPATIAIEHARLHADAREHARVLAATGAVARAATERPDPALVRRHVVEAARALVPGAAVALLRRERAGFRLVEGDPVLGGVDAPWDPRDPLLAGPGGVVHHAVRRVPLEGDGSLLSATLRKDGLRRLTVVPLRFAGATQALLLVAERDVAARRNALEALADLGDHAALALRCADAHARLAASRQALVAGGEVQPEPGGGRAEAGRRVADLPSLVAEVVGARSAARDGSGDDPTVDLDVHGSALVDSRPEEIREAVSRLVDAVAASAVGASSLRVESGEMIGPRGRRAYLRLQASGSPAAGAALGRGARPPRGAAGVDLAAACRLLRRHRADIAVDSGPDGRIHVQATFPVASPPGVAEAAVVAREGASHALRILLVDDDTETRAAVGELLRSWGHDVRIVASGYEALEALLDQRVDLVLTDLGMPGLDGWEVARRARDLDRPPAVALLTGWGLDLDEGEARRRGVEAVLEKPAHVDELRALLARVAPSDGPS